MKSRGFASSARRSKAAAAAAAADVPLRWQVRRCFARRSEGFWEGHAVLDGADVVSDAGVASSYAALTSVSDQLLKDTAKFKCHSSLVHRHRSESAYISS